MGWTGQDERGESSALGPVKSRRPGPGRHGPRAQNRRGGAPEGVRAASKRAPRESAEDKVLRLPALRLPSPDAGLFDIRIGVPRLRGEMAHAFVIARRRKPPKQSRRFEKNWIASLRSQ